MVIEHGIVPCMVPLLTEGNNRVLTRTVLAFANIMHTADAQMQAVPDATYECDVYRYIPNLLRSPRIEVSNVAWWILSNMAATSQQHVQTIIEKGLISSVIRFLNEVETWVLYHRVGF